MSEIRAEFSKFNEEAVKKLKSEGKTSSKNTSKNGQKIEPKMLEEEQTDTMIMLYYVALAAVMGVIFAPLIYDLVLFIFYAINGFTSAV